MAVYLSLTAAVVLLGMMIRNREFVKHHTAPVNVGAHRSGDRELGSSGGHENVSEAGGSGLGGACPGINRRDSLTRQQAFHIGIAVMIFLLLTAVSAGRIAVGNDYWGYRDNFKLIMQGRHVSYEWGFRGVVRVLQTMFGYDNYLPVFGFFSILTCFFFVKAVYDQGEWFGASMFLLMTGGYYFSSLNSVRYYLVLAVALYSMKYVLQRRYGIFILWILAASAFHKSVLVVIPIYLFADFLSRIRWKKWYVVLLAGLAVAAVLGEPLWRKVIFLFYPFYEGSVFDVRNFSWMNIAKCLGTLVLCAICFRKGILEHTANRFYFFLNVGGILIYTCCTFVPEISRIGYYLIASQIFLLPNLLQDMKKGWLKNLCVLGVGGAFALHFALFLYQAYDVNIRLLPYLSWVFD